MTMTNKEIEKDEHDVFLEWWESKQGQFHCSHADDKEMAYSAYLQGKSESEERNKKLEKFVGQIADNGVKILKRPTTQERAQQLQKERKS